MATSPDLRRNWRTRSGSVQSSNVPTIDAGLRVLSEGTDPNFDIIIVLELDRELPAQSRWAAGNTFWPRDFLPQKFPRARILVYGFYPPSKLRNWKHLICNGDPFLKYGITLLESIEKKREPEVNIKPIVFLCEGLGGVLVQEALLSSDRRTGWIAYLTSGVIFLDLESTKKSPSKALQKSLDRCEGITHILDRYSISRPYYFTKALATNRESLEGRAYSVDGYQFVEEDNHDFETITESITTVLRERGVQDPEFQGSTPSPQVVSVASDQSQLEVADELDEQILATDGVAQDPECLEIVATGTNPAATDQAQWWKRAEDLEQKVMITRKEVLGVDHPDTLAAMAHLALMYRNQRRWKEAEDLEVQVVAARIRVLGEDNTDTLTAMAQLALMYQDQRRWKEAEDLEVQVLASRRRILGDGHPDTLRAMTNLALTYWNLKRWKEAEVLEVQVIVIRERVLGKDHPHTLTAMANLAVMYGYQGRWKESEDLEMQVMTERKKVLGVDHPDTLTAMANLAVTYQNQGRLDDAEDLQVATTRGRILAKDHPDALTALFGLAATYYYKGRWPEVKGLQVITARGDVPGKGHPGTLTATAGLAATYHNQRRWEETEGLQVLATRKMVLGKDHPDTLAAMAQLALMYQNQGRLEEAEKLEEQVMATRERVLDKDHLDTLTAMNNLAMTYRYQERLEEAEGLEAQILAIRGTILGKLHSENKALGLGKDMSLPSVPDPDHKSTLPSISAPPALQQGIVKEVGGDIAKTFGGSTEVSMIMTEALERQSLAAVDRRLSHAIKTFLNISKLPMANELSADNLKILRNISNTNTLDAITLKIREFSMPSHNLGYQDLRLEGHPPKQKRAHEPPQSQLSDKDLEDFGSSEEPNKPDDEVIRLDKSKDTVDPNNEGESMHSAGSIREMLVYLKSEGIIGMFERAFIRESRGVLPNGKQGDDTGIISGDARPLENVGVESVKKTTDVIDNNEALNGRTYDDISAGSGIGSRNIGSCTSPRNEHRQGSAGSSTTGSTDLRNGGISSTEQAADSLPRLTTEFYYTRGSTIPYTLMDDSGYSWPARFANDKTDIKFEIVRRWSLLNESKGWIEELVREPINWWPLNPRRHSLPEGFVWVNWKCRCGKRLSSVISKKRMCQYNQWIDSNNGTPPPSDHKPAATVTSGQDYQAIAKSGGSSAAGSASSSPVTNLSGNTSSVPVTPTELGGQEHCRDIRLMWCVNLGSRLTLLRDLEVCSNDNDAAIFRNLKMKYWEIRGWRRWFSLYSISDIKFVKFRPYRLDRVKCYSKQELPIPNDPSYQFYDYLPRPPEEVPPVPVELLMEYFEDPSCAGTSAKLLETFPKKINGQMGQQEKYGWGLRACEHLSFLRVTILSVAILIGPICFFIHWLLKYPGDLQNASIPLFLAFALIGTFIVLPHYFN